MKPPSWNHRPKKNRMQLLLLLVLFVCKSLGVCVCVLRFFRRRHRRCCFYLLLHLEMLNDYSHLWQTTLAKRKENIRNVSQKHTKADHLKMWCMLQCCNTLWFTHFISCCRRRLQPKKKTGEEYERGATAATAKNSASTPLMLMRVSNTMPKH